MSIKLTPFGLAVRELRLKIGGRIIDMARQLDTSSAYISAIETGRKNLTKNYLEKVVEYFESQGVDASHLWETLEDSQNEYKIRLEGESLDSRQLAAAFARKFPTLDDKEKRELLDFLSK